MVQVESLHRSFSIVIRHPFYDVLVDDVFNIVADVGPYVVVYVVSYVSPCHLPDGRVSIQSIRRI